MLKSITLLGSSSGRNAGDAALLSAIMDSCDEACDTRLLYEIPSLNPEFVWRTYENRVRPLNILPWTASLKLLGLPTYRSLMRSDMSLIFDATLFDRSLYNPFFNFMSSYAALLPIAKRRGKRMGCFTVTVGPVTTPKGRDMLKRLMDMMDFLTVRDQDSVDALAEAKVDNPRVLITNDCALLTRPSSEERTQEIFKTIGLDQSREILAINVNTYFDSWAGTSSQPMTKEQFVTSYVKGLELALKDIDADLLFISTQHQDHNLTEEIMQKVKTPHRKAFFSNRVYNHHEVRGVMEKAALLFAMRLHCLILTSAGHTPIASLDYLPKVTTYLKSMGLSRYSMSFKNFTAEKVAEHLSMSWSERKQIREKLDLEIPRMKSEVLKAPALVAAIHRGEDINRAFERIRTQDVSQLSRAA